MDRLECDRMFVAVMETGSFIKAASRIGTSSSQASKLVTALEGSLGVRLLNRTTRSVSPTEAGRAYFERLRILLEEFDTLDASIKNISVNPRGRLRLTAPLTFGTVELAPLLNHFVRQYAEIELDVSLSDRMVNLVDEGFDLAIRIGRPDDSSLVARKLCDIRLFVVGSADYFAQRGEPRVPADIVGHDCIIDTNLREPDHWFFRDREGSQIAVPVHGRLRYSNGEACLLAAEAGLGLAYMPSVVALPAIRAGRVRPVLLEHEPTPLPVHALYPHSRHLAAKVRVLVDFLIEHYRDGLSDRV